MKILVSFESRVRPDSTGNYYLKAFRDMGHEVDHVLPSDIMFVKGGYDLYFRCDDGMYAEWNKELHPSIFQVIDTHLDVDFRLKMANEGEFDLVSVAQKEGINLPWNSKAVWGPLACDAEIHHVGERDKIFDGVFVGNFHTQYASERIETVHAFFDVVPKLFFGSRTFKELTEKYAQSKLVLNQAIHNDPLNMRFFEALCSGSCLVSSRLKEGETLGFVDGVHYAGYSSLPELREVVKDLLENDAKREGIAREGRRAATQHTYASRLRDLMEQLPEKTEKTNGFAISR